ncbi:hypothetical protein T459_19634 [Capsicum annuum]|uniref:Thymidine kinase n=1 Tax=Capsicum annuum TaxID=4072 RepID=A0A2G2Z260_CAPAN|nr:hypothetical protein T459_19634 [Capsicum annuum]
MQQNMGFNEKSARPILSFCYIVLLRGVQIRCMVNDFLISLQGEVEGTQDLLMRWVYLWMEDVIGIDVAQFFDDICDFCRNAAGLDGKTVIAAGLNADY